MSTVDSLAKDIMEVLIDYHNDIAENLKLKIDIAANECNEEIKKNVTFKQPTGDYVKSFRIKTDYEDRFGKSKRWYVKEPHYRLTHLLEKGHALRGGGRSTAFPHIQYGEELAIKRMEELAVEAIEDAGR